MSHITSTARHASPLLELQQRGQSVWLDSISRGMMAAARQLMTIVKPDTKIIPGHLGPIVGFKEIEQQLTMFAAVRDRIAAAIKAGESEAEVVASKPTRDFDAGRMGGAITPDRFVSLVYTDLSRRLK